MVEKAKSVLLIILVATSLFQSYQLAYHSTNYEQIRESEYIDTELIGTQEKVDNLVFPHQIVIHENSESHSVLYPEHSFYKIIMEDLKKRSYEGIRISEKPALLLKQLMNEQAGIEIRFPSPFPLQVIRHAIPLQIGLISDNEWIHTMWLTVSGESGIVDIFLLGEDFADAYEVTSSDLTADKVREYIRFGEFQSPKYALSPYGFLYPTESVAIQRLTYRYTGVSGDRMGNMLFPDPGITRSLPTRDSSEIYSDGKRGLEINNDQQWMSYTDPMASIGGTFNSRSDLNAATQFVNRYGGWNGRYGLERIVVSDKQAQPNFIYRQWLSSFPYAYPIVSKTDNRFGYISVWLQQDVITQYERSLRMLEESGVERTETYLPGGEALLARIAKFGAIAQIKRITPAYKPNVIDGVIEFVPIWAVVLGDGTMLELP